MSHAHLLTLTLLMVRVRRYHACSCLSLQSHLPLSIGYLLDLHSNFYCCGWRARRGLLLLLWYGRLALGLTDGLLASNSSSHANGSRLMLGRCCGAKDWFALGLMDRGGSWGPVGIYRQIGGVLLELLRIGSCSTLLLQLDLRKHLLLMLGRAHYPPSPTSSTHHLLKLMVKGVLRRHATLWRHPTWLLLLLDSRYRTHSLLRDWSHSLSRGLRCWGLGSTGCWGAWCRGAIVPWGGKSYSRSSWWPSSWLPHSLHARHPPPQHLGLLKSVLQLLLSQLLLDVQTEWNRTFVLLTVFGMVAAQSNELLANGTAAICLALAAFCVLNNPLHLLTGWQRAVGVAALACVDQ